MTRTLILFFFFTASLTSFSQRGFYKSIYGNWGEHLTVPNFARVNKLPNGEFFVTSAVNYSTDYFTCSKLNGDFNVIWEKSYLKAADSPTNRIDYGMGLTDGTIASVGIYPGTVVIMHSPDGELISCNRYGKPGANYHIGTIQKSSLPDSSAVFTIGQCAILYGLIKVNKHGEVVWAHDYFNGHTKARIYTLELGADYGYVTVGNRSDPIDEISFWNSSVVTLSNDDGTFRKATIIKSISPSRNTLELSVLETSKVENAYYVAIFTKDNRDWPVITDNYHQILKLNSDLEIVKQWKLETSDENIRLRIMNMTETTNGELIINGNLRDTTDYSTKFFVAKIDPTADGSIVWSKHIKGAISPGINHIANAGLETFGAYDDILFSFHSVFDGAMLASLDQNGEGFCNSTDIEMSLEEVTLLSNEPYEMSPSTPEIYPYPVTMTEAEKWHQDTMICYTSDLSIDHLEDAPDLVNWYSLDPKKAIIRNTTNDLVEISLYNLQGQLVYETQILSNNSVIIPTNGNLLLFRARQNEKYQVGKIK